MLREPGRLVASLIAIMVGVGFATLTLVLSASVGTLVAAEDGSATGSSVVVHPNQKSVDLDFVTEARALPGVWAVQGKVVTWVTGQHQGQEMRLELLPVPRLDRGARLVDGRLPRATDEVLVVEQLATRKQLRPGSTIDIIPTSSSEVTGRLTVVGVLSRPDTHPDAEEVFALEADVLRYAESGFFYVFIFSDRSPAEVKAQVAALPSAQGLRVRTLDEYRADEEKEFAQLQFQVLTFFLGFSGVALLVGGLVIFNTFSVLVAQRTRQLALLRCVGATRGQVFRQVLVEAVGLGLVAGGVGAVGGMGLGFVMMTFLQYQIRQEESPFTVTLASVTLPLAVGLCVSVLAALLPALRATRVAPLVALRPQREPVKATRAGVVGGLLVAVGTAALLYGAVKPGMGKELDQRYPVVGAVGAAVTLVGVLVLAIVLVPALTKVVGLVTSRIGLPGWLAAGNSRRNPARAATTASALVIGVTLVSATLVGAATGQRTYDEVANRVSPVDLILTPFSGQVSDDMLRQAQGSSLLVAVTRVERGAAKVNGTEQEVVGVDSGIWAVVRDQRRLQGLSNSTVLLPASSGIAPGSLVTLSGPAGEVGLTAVVPPTQPDQPVVTQAVLAKVTDERTQSLWARAVEGKKSAEVVAGVTRDLPGPASAEGALPVRASLEVLLTVLLFGITALLGVSVLVAVIGITNTLTLSVLERSQESALLRALGLARSQLRWMYSLEALTLAAVGSLIGVGLGTGFGIAGAYMLLKGSVPVAVAVPWGQLALVVAGAVLAALVASVVPAGRAAQVQPGFALLAE